LISVGTGWGGLAETHDFLRKLFDSGETLSSPTDFVGSVHNAPAGQAAMLLEARGPNLTSSSGDLSFEHAVLCASLMLHGETKTALIAGADAWHDALSPLLDPERVSSGPPSDGGAAFVVTVDDGMPGPRLKYLGEGGGDVVGVALREDGYGAVLVGVPAGEQESSSAQLEDLRRMLDPSVPVTTYRDTTGHYATASAVATAMAVRMVQAGGLGKPRVLMISLGAHAAAMEVFA
jgi:hypothetical protein